ncbi:hypothetical protein [Actinoplanes sp. N902-109]|uniref:hypothetical protein n=1 Tax=Actinoplanes sp. (strain N902-109) TaxID=649831 RepID=UPI00032953D7|nr:hypothetical protein [Actinoplanes sp. N902-109]AGL13872.1 hypothetical protein L083_0362 [Actinoplanes sp. N902-109]
MAASKETKQAPAAPPPARADTDVSGSVQEVQARMDEITEQGYQGTSTDPTPNENYTVGGVTSGAPTPETDKDAARAVREHLDQVESPSTDK